MKTEAERLTTRNTSQQNKLQTWFSNVSVLWDVGFHVVWAPRNNDPVLVLCTLWLIMPRIMLCRVSTFSSLASITEPFLSLCRMSHVLQFEDKSRKVKDASMQDSDTFEIYDPRNPVNKRRREESKKLLRERKERRWSESIDTQNQLNMRLL